MKQVFCEKHLLTTVDAVSLPQTPEICDGARNLGWFATLRSQAASRRNSTMLPMAFTLCLGLPGLSQAGLLTDIEKNAFVVAETAALTASMLAEQYGVAAQTLVFSSTAFSGSNWQFDLAGSYLGNPVALAFSGSFNPATDEGVFNSTGTIGTDAWNGTGTWKYVDLAVDTDGLQMDFSQAIGLTGFFLDRHILDPKKELTTDDGTTRHTISQGKYIRTILGIPVGMPIDQTDDSIGPSGGGGIATVAVSLVDENIFLTGTYEQDGGYIQGNVQVVPEPGAWAMMLAGLAGLLGFSQLRRN